MSLNHPSLWVFKDIDKIVELSCGKGTDVVSDGQCLASWMQVCRLKSSGGLGIQDLEIMNIAHQLRYAWRVHLLIIALGTSC